MELRHLRYFLAVCEELHFGRAAKRLHVSQPPLSQQIRQLEEELRVRLFFRNKRRVELTDAGRVLAGEARLILQQVERAAGLVLKENRSIQNRLVVGFSPANAHVALAILKAFSQRFPRTHLIAKSLVTFQQVEALRSGRIDVGFLTLPVEREGLVAETILRELHLVALPRNHPLASRRRIPLRALANETLIIFPLSMSPGRYQLIAGLCRHAGFSLHVVHEVDNIPTILELVSAGFGVSLVRASVKEIRKSGVVYRELQHSPTVETAIAYRSENRLARLHDFVELSKKVASQRWKTLLSPRLFRSHSARAGESIPRPFSA
ncbi:MAG TPA: LysR substrate-binding domain-containing protein [Terriglobia bacterium]|nr:LysR substrate-binding domain-containing protein [Terriglobia bacterium]